MRRVCVSTPGCVGGSAVHTSCPASYTSEPPPAPGLQLAAAPDTRASWELPCCWWERLQEAGAGPGLKSPPEPSRSAAPSSVQPPARTTEQRPAYQSHGVRMWGGPGVCTRVKLVQACLPRNKTFHITRP